MRGEGRGGEERRGEERRGEGREGRRGEERREYKLWYLLGCCFLSKLSFLLPC